MADAEHLAILKQGVTTWNAWRKQHSLVAPELSGADLYRADLRGADLSQANLSQVNLRRAVLRRSDLNEANLVLADLNGANLSQAVLDRANLRGAKLNGAKLGEVDLSQANLRGAHLHDATLFKANLTGSDLRRASLRGANLSQANLHEANLYQANLRHVNLSGADVSDADLSEAELYGADLSRANLHGAYLIQADLRTATLVEADLTQAMLSDCAVHGISCWNVRLAGAVQVNLRINAPDEPTVTVDNLDVAQFLYLMLHNQKIRDILDTLTSKVVLILGRFTPERKAVLEALREALRQRNYVPVLFDFEGPESHDFTETVTLLARMARFIIADLTEPASIPHELQAIVPDVMVPVQPLIAADARPFAMFVDHRKYHWMLPIYRYPSLEGLLATLQERVIAPVEAKAREIRKLRQAEEE